MNDLVWSDALVIPSNNGVASAVFSPLEIKSLLYSKNSLVYICSPTKYVESPTSVTSLY